MTDTFINTKDRHRVNAASKIMQYPHKYFANPKNIQRLKEIFESTEHIHNFLDWFSLFQTDLNQHLSFDLKDKKGFVKIQSVIHDKTDQNTGIESHFAVNGAPFHATSKLIKHLNINVAENINSLQINESAISPELIAKLIQSSWLAEHFALLLLGALELTCPENDKYEFRPRNPKFMDFVWFGMALENSSVESDNVAIKAFAEHLTSGNPDDRNTYNELLANVYSIVGKQWRIGTEKPIKDLFNKLADLIVLLITVCQREMGKYDSKPLSKADVRKMSFQSDSLKDLPLTYEEVKRFQKTLLVEDRLFNIEKGGLVQGPLEATRGLISQMENFAFKRYGANWQGQMEKHQKAHILEHLYDSSHLDVLDFELKSDHVEKPNRGKVKLDVDLFVRDNRVNLIYAVQLKHLKQIKESGVSSWLKMIGEFDSKLNTAVLQLQNLREIIDNDKDVKSHLIKHGINEGELKTIIPVVVHNVGYMDMLSVQNNVWLYDQITFRKVLTGQSGIKHIFKDGRYHYDDFLVNSDGALRLDQPRAIIESYLSSKDFYGFRFFNVAKDLIREINVGDTSIKSIGIGL